MTTQGNELAGVTVDERLFACGLLDQYDRARSERDLDALRSIFQRIALPDYPLEELLR